MYPCRLRVCVCVFSRALVDGLEKRIHLYAVEYRERECNENDGPIFVFKNSKRNDARSFRTHTHIKTVYKICFVCLVLGEQPSLKCGLRFDTMISFG